MLFKLYLFCVCRCFHPDRGQHLHQILQSGHGGVPANCAPGESNLRPCVVWLVLCFCVALLQPGGGNWSAADAGCQDNSRQGALWFWCSYRQVIMNLKDYSICFYLFIYSFQTGSQDTRQVKSQERRTAHKLALHNCKQSHKKNLINWFCWTSLWMWCIVMHTSFHLLDILFHLLTLLPVMLWDVVKQTRKLCEPG